MTPDLNYQFVLPKHKTIQFGFKMKGERYSLIVSDLVTPPWSQLAFHKCSHCPLHKSESKHCPAALQLAQVVEAMDKVLHYSDIVVEVNTQLRTVRKECSAEEGISSLLGLLLANSGCPHTNFLLPMARYHLPFADSNETFWRACASFMLAQYFRKEKGERFEDLSELKRKYENLETLNHYLVKRLQSQVNNRTYQSAITLLDQYAKQLPLFLDNSADQLNSLYENFL